MRKFFILDSATWDKYQKIIPHLTRSWEEDEGEKGKPLMQQSGTLTFTLGHDLLSEDDVATIKNILETIVTPDGAPEPIKALHSTNDKETTLGLHCKQLKDFAQQFGLHEDAFEEKPRKQSELQLNGLNGMSGKPVTIDWPNVRCFKNRNGGGYFLLTGSSPEAEAIKTEMKDRRINCNTKLVSGGQRFYRISILPSVEQVQKLERDLKLPLSDALSVPVAQARLAT